MSENQIRRIRREKDLFFESSPNSPLTDEQKAAFDGLRYFDYNPDLVFSVLPDPVDGPETIQIMTTTNEIRSYRRHGRFTFTVAGQDCQLTIYETPHGYFLPFVDASKQTYGAGRYIDLQRQVDGSFIVDFNLAYNPLCVYNEQYSCPLTPPENHLRVEIHAGEMLPEGNWIVT